MTLSQSLTAKLAMLAGLFSMLTTTDSATAASTTQSPGDKVLVVIGASYARSWGEPALPGYVVVNKGVAGEETGDMAKRFAQDVVGKKPDAVLIWGHVNNITRANAETLARKKQDARAHYLAMLDQARAAGIKELWLATEVPLAEAGGFKNALAGFIGKLRGKQSYATRVNAHVRELNDYVRSLAPKYQAKVLDFHGVFEDGSGLRRAQYAQADMSHITPAGYAALTNYTQQQMRR